MVSKILLSCSSLKNKDHVVSTLIEIILENEAEAGQMVTGTNLLQPTTFKIINVVKLIATKRNV